MNFKVFDFMKNKQFLRCDNAPNAYAEYLQEKNIKWAPEKYSIKSVYCKFCGVEYNKEGKTKDSLIFFIESNDFYYFVFPSEKASQKEDLQKGSVEEIFALMDNSLNFDGLNFVENCKSEETSLSFIKVHDFFYDMGLIPLIMEFQVPSNLDDRENKERYVYSSTDKYISAFYDMEITDIVFFNALLDKNGELALLIGQLINEKRGGE